MHFTHAIVRPPASTFADGITSSDLGRPDLSLALQQHESYCRALEALGLALTRLPADPEFPDSTFVEDAAIVTAEGAILTRPGAPTRAGEVHGAGRGAGPVVSSSWTGLLRRAHSTAAMSARRATTSSSAYRTAPTKRGPLNWRGGSSSAASGRV